MSQYSSHHSNRYCGHGISLDRECKACEVLFRIEERQQDHKEQLLELLHDIEEILMSIERSEILPVQLLLNSQLLLNCRYRLNVLVADMNKNTLKSE